MKLLKFIKEIPIRDERISIVDWSTEDLCINRSYTELNEDDVDEDDTEIRDSFLIFEEEVIKKTHPSIYIAGRPMEYHYSRNPYYRDARLEDSTDEEIAELEFENFAIMSLFKQTKIKDFKIQYLKYNYHHSSCYLGSKYFIPVTLLDCDIIGMETGTSLVPADSFIRVLIDTENVNQDIIKQLKYQLFRRYEFSYGDF